MTYAAPQYALPTPQVLPVSSLWTPFSGHRIGWSPGVPVVSTNPTANQAIYVPFVVTTTAIFTRGFWYNGSGTLAGNTSVGIYTPDQTRQCTTGAIAQSGGSVIQSAAFTAAYTATPGVYYMGILFSATTASGCFAYAASATFRSAGLYTEATGVAALPATAVFATWASFVVPYFGITQTSFAI
jgi:hypothetical protein